MQRRQSGFLAAVCIALLIAGTACGRPYKIIRAEVPGPLGSATSVTVLPIDHGGLMIGSKTEGAYVSDKTKGNPEFSADWNGKKSNWSSRLVQGITDHTQGRQVSTGQRATELALAVTIQRIEPGFYTYVLNKNSDVRAIVRISDVRKSGDPIYEFTVVSQSSGWSDRVGRDYSMLGHFIATFMNDALNGKLKAK